MEVAIAEEKKKIFRARKTMKFSDRQQLDSLHATLLTGSSPPSSANVSPPPLVNGVHHKEDVGQRAGPDKEHRSNNSSSSNAVARAAPSPASSRGSPDISLSLTLSPSPPAVVVSAEDALPLPASPASPFHSLNFELKKMEEKEVEKKDEEEEEKKRKEPPPTSKDCPVLNGDGGGKEEAAPVVTKAENKGEALHATAEEAPSNSPEEERRPITAHSEPMETDSGPEEGKPSAASSAQGNAEEKPSSSPRSSSSSPKEQEVKEEGEGEEAVKEGQGGEGGDGARKGSPKVEKMEVDHVKVEKLNMMKTEVGMSGKTSRPSSTPPSDAVQEKSSTSGVKRTLSEGDEEGTPKDKRCKKPKVDGLELEAQLELKITAKGGSRIKLEKVVQQLVEEQLRALQLSVMDKSLQELKEKVDAIDCDTKHQTALKTLQAKIVRLVKKFGTANQVSENKRKQEALAAAAASAAATAAKNVAAAAVTSQQRLVRTSFEVKQTPTTLSPTVTTATASAPAPPTSSAVVTQAPILQIITSSSSPSTTLAQAISTQSPTGTLLFKTTSGGNVMTPGQPLLIQLPLSMTNGQTGTLVKFPVTSFASSGLGKAKTTAPTATFILKTAPAITTTAATLTGPVTATVPALQASGGATAGIGGQMSPAQLSLARAVYQGGVGGMGMSGTGVSATAMARAPAQLVSVAGAMMTTTMSASSSLSAVATSLPANSSGPAATGSAAPGPPQGTSLTSKTDNPSTTPAKTPTAPRPKGSVIDLTEDDDDVLVTSVKKATVTPSSTTQRSVVTVPTSSGVKSTPSISSNPQLTVHHRPPLDSPLKSRPGAPTSSAAASTPSTPSSTRPSAITLPALPAAPAVRLPPEAGQTSAPQQPQLKLVPSPTGIVLSWCVAETDRSCAAVDSYHLYAFHQDNNNSATTSQHWKKIGEVKALPLPMACTLTQFQSGSTYHFAVRAKDVYGRYGTFCEPQCTNVITSSAS